MRSFAALPLGGIPTTPYPKAASSIPDGSKDTQLTVVFAASGGLALPGEAPVASPAPPSHNLSEMHLARSGRSNFRAISGMRLDSAAR